MASGHGKWSSFIERLTWQNIQPVEPKRPKARKPGDPLYRPRTAANIALHNQISALKNANPGITAASTADMATNIGPSAPAASKPQPALQAQNKMKETKSVINSFLTVEVFFFSCFDILISFYFRVIRPV